MSKAQMAWTRQSEIFIIPHAPVRRGKIHIGRRETTKKEEEHHHKRFGLICNILMAWPLTRVQRNLIRGQRT